MRVVVLDPGESTGWVLAVDGELYAAGTVPKNHLALAALFSWIDDDGGYDVMVYETFQLYPGKAQSQSWSTFYTVEVIGILKLWSMVDKAELIGYAPSVKKFAGAYQPDWQEHLNRGNPPPVPSESSAITEHTRDAYKLWQYYKRMQKGKTR